MNQPENRSPLRLRERLALRGEITLRDVARAIARCNRIEARRIADDLIDQVPLLHGGMDWPALHEALEQCMFDEGIPAGVNSDVEKILFLLRNRARDVNLDGRVLSSFAQMSAEEAWDILAQHVGRPDLLGRFLDYDAGEVLASLCGPAMDDERIVELFHTALLDPYVKSATNPLHLSRLLIDDAFSLRHALELSDSVAGSRILGQLRGLSKLDAIRLLQRLLPGAAAHYDSAIADELLKELVRVAYLEGVRVVNDLGYHEDSAAAQTRNDEALRGLFYRAGFPRLEGLDEEDACEAVRRVPRRLASLILDVAYARAWTELPDFLGIELNSTRWQVLRDVERVPTLQELATAALPTQTAWREVCERVGFADLAGRGDSQARRAVAAESIAVEVPDELVEASRLEQLMRDPQTKRVAKQRTAWRALAVEVGRPDLATRVGDAAARELSAAALTYTGQANILPLVHRAGLAELQRRNSVREIARQSKGKQPELSR